MSLTAQEKSKIISHLGWPAKSIIADTTDYNNTLVGRLEGLTTPFETEVRTLLDKLLKTDDGLESAQSRLLAKQVGDIVLRDDEIYQLKKEKKRLLRQLSDLLGIQIRSSGGNMIGICI